MWLTRVTRAALLTGIALLAARVALLSGIARRAGVTAYRLLPVGMLAALRGRMPVIRLLLLRRPSRRAC